MCFINIAWEQAYHRHNRLCNNKRLKLKPQDLHSVNLTRKEETVRLTQGMPLILPDGLGDVDRKVSRQD